MRIRSRLSLAGVALTTVSALLFLILFALDLLGLINSPYIGLLIYVALPAAFALGLIAIPLGNWRRGHADADASLWPVFDFNSPRTRKTMTIVAFATLANIVVISMASYGAVHYTETPQFCGQVCHTVMHPEFTAYQDGPHARVACVDCHVGEGAASFARAKLAGVRQLVHVVTGRYPRPVPEPARSLRPARETCERCHWPEKFHGDKTRRVYEYAEDEANTESVTTLQVHVGGGSQRLGIAAGIHWHMNIANEVEYIATDDKRQTIPWVRIKDRFGAVREYVVAGVTPEQLAKGERRRMDCMDCHNRPSHVISMTPERAVNDVLARGDMSKTLPFIRREAVKAIKASYTNQTAAAQGVSRSLSEFYRSEKPDVYASRRADVDKAVQITTAIYLRNVFPEMNVLFGTYSNNIGHIDSPGCFRCHDDDHKSKEGKAIGQDCETCHHIE
jgi:NapC/NirT cytochrome c family, N-terminal region